MQQRGITGKSVLGKMPPGILPPGKLPLGKLSHGKLSPMKLFCEFFFISSFYFYENFFAHKKNLFSFNYFFYYKFVWIIFDFQAWNIMFIKHIWVTDNAGHQPQCCLTFSQTELQMLLRCSLIYISIILLRRFIYLLYLCPCLHLRLFMPY